MPTCGFFQARTAPARSQVFQAGSSQEPPVFSGSHQPGTGISRLVPPETEISRLVTSPDPRFPGWYEPARTQDFLEPARNQPGTSPEQ